MTADSHGHNHNDFADLRKKNKRVLMQVLALTFVFMIVEIVVGLYSKSLALIADAGHMLSDSAGVFLALLAIWFASRPATKSKTYGYYRTEIFAAFANGIILLSISLYILIEAIQRFYSQPAVQPIPMLAVSIVGLIVNILSARLLSSGSEHSLNMKGAYLEVVSDMLASAGVIVASLIIMITGWQMADTIISVIIGTMIIPRTGLLLRDCVNILMEGTPAHINLEEIQQGIMSIAGVIAVHDLHVWTITSGKDAMSGHVVIANDVPADETLKKITNILETRFKLHHTTVQVEVAQCKSNEKNSCAL